MTLDDIPEITRLTETLKFNLTQAAQAQAGKLEIRLDWPLDMAELRGALNDRAYEFFMDRAERARLDLYALTAREPAAAKATEEGAQAQAPEALCDEVPTEGAK